MDTADIQKRIRRWIETRLGTGAMNPRERALRCVEEVAELAQSLNVSLEEFERIGQHVWAKPIGDVRQELGGAALTLLGCADGVGELLGQAAIRELERIESLPPEKFRRRQLENIQNGIGEF